MVRAQPGLKCLDGGVPGWRGARMAGAGRQACSPEPCAQDKCIPEALSKPGLPRPSNYLTCARLSDRPHNTSLHPAVLRALHQALLQQPPSCYAHMQQGVAGLKEHFHSHPKQRQLVVVDACRSRGVCLRGCVDVWGGAGRKGMCEHAGGGVAVRHAVLQWRRAEISRQAGGRTCERAQLQIGRNVGQLTLPMH